MKINVVYNTTDAPFGGGNQFIKALKNEFLIKGLLSSEEDADLFLFNSHHNISKVVELKNAYPKKKFVHRLDGPMRLYNDMSDVRDQIVYDANYSVADATVFQSEWSYQANIRLGLSNDKLSTVILNGVDDSIFCEIEEKQSSDKIRVISTSFSPNIKKGFNLYKSLDDTLDFDKFEYVFAGNSPVKFKNIKNLGCLNSSKLSDRLRRSDLFITASEKDPCSNSLIEAIACGLDILAFNDGGHTEIVNNDECLFSSLDELLEKLTICNFDKAKKKYSVKESAQKYIDFFDLVCSA